MNSAMDKSVRTARFAISDLQKRVAVLEATREDLERQMRKLNDSVPEEEVAPDARKDGYVAYGSYANSVILRKKNLQVTIDDIEIQNTDLSSELRMAMDTLDSFERVRARQLAAKAEKVAARRAG
ncbi:MAG: flagellar export protein FliJ [Robiginitomaculum sp.]|nr:flagellar export protein FliJ [Robiginitomaculum sp.]